jgi:hypothetical protein
MDNAKKHSVNKSIQPTVKPEGTANSVGPDFTMEDFTPTNNRLAKKSKKFSNPESSHYISQCSGLQMGLMEIFKIKKLLNYKDLRSVIHWCTKNDVFIIHQGNKQFVNKWEFILSFYKPFIKHLKRKHKNWKDMFLNYLNGEVNHLLATSNEDATISTTRNYKPIDKVGADFLKNINEL